MTADSAHVPLVRLNNGVAMPQLGFGLSSGLGREDTIACVDAALQAGFRSFDTATRYRNERALGAALARSGLPREELFVTTKVWNSDHGRDPTFDAFDASLDRLGLDYVDLYLIHFPAPLLGLYVETWLALEELHRSGRARAIGVCNFEAHHLATILSEGSVVPAINQIELHPRLQQHRLRAVHARHGIQTEAWSPLARGLLVRDPLVASIAARHGATPAQIVLRWHLQLGTVVIPKTVTPARMRENLDALILPALDEHDMALLASLDCGGRIGPDPNLFVDTTGDRRDLESRWDRMVAESDP